MDITKFKPAIVYTIYIASTPELDDDPDEAAGAYARRAEGDGDQDAHVIGA